MKFDLLLEILGDEPIFETGLLLAGNVSPEHVRRQLSRWVNAGKILQLRRGVYCLAPPYQKTKPHPFLIANRIRPGSYVSLQSALAWHGMIPEYVPVTTSVTTGRPGRFETPLGQFHYQHVKTAWFHSYSFEDVGEGQRAFIASLEKSLLDLVYLQPGGDSQDYLRSLRLQALGQVNVDKLSQLTDRSRKPKLARASEEIQQLIKEEQSAYVKV